MSYRVLVLSLVAFLMPACGDSHESAAEDQLDLMEEMAELMEGIKSEDDAKEAAEVMKKIGEKMEKLQKEMKELGDPSPEKEKELEKEYKPRMIEMQKRVQKAMMNLTKYPELLQAMGKAMSAN